MVFIKLTEWKSLKETFINPAQIIEMRPQKDSSTVLFYIGEDFTLVKETPREIMDLIKIEKDLKNAMDNIR